MKEHESLRTRSCWIVEPGRAELRDGVLGILGPGEARVRTLFSGVSRGTESLVFSGKVPASEHQRMRAPFQEGDFPGPVKYGYINVGLVEAGPAALIGERVFCLYPHQNLYQVPASRLTVLPAAIPAERGVLAAGMETALNALWDAEIKIGDSVVVIGAGVIGSLVAYLASQVAGTQVLLVDVNPERAQLAASLGVAFATPGQGGGSADLVLHASGSGRGLSEALSHAGNEARIIEMSWYGNSEVQVPLGQAFHAKRLRIQSSQVGGIPASQSARWDYRRRLECALSLLEDPALDALIDGESDFADLPKTLARICAPQASSLCHRVRYPAPTSKEK